MTSNIEYVGMDVHKQSISIACQKYDSVGAEPHGGTTAMTNSSGTFYGQSCGPVSVDCWCSDGYRNWSRR